MSELCFERDGIVKKTEMTHDVSEHFGLLIHSFCFVFFGVMVGVSGDISHYAAISDVVLFTFFR